MELAKTRMQTQGVGMRRKSKLLTYSGPVDCLKKIYKREGLPGLSRGLGLTVLRESPSFGVYFMSYECISGYLKSKSDSTVSTGVLLLSGGLAGQCSWLSTYPVDVIKTRIQNDSCGEYRNASIACSARGLKVASAVSSEVSQPPCFVRFRSMLPPF